MKRKLRMKAMALSSVLAINNFGPVIEVMAENMTFNEDNVINSQTSRNSTTNDEITANEAGEYIVSEDAIQPNVKTFTSNGENNPTKWDGKTVSSEVERLAKAAIQKTLESIGTGITTPEVERAIINKTKTITEEVAVNEPVAETLLTDEVVEEVGQLGESELIDEEVTEGLENSNNEISEERTILQERTTEVQYVAFEDDKLKDIVKEKLTSDGIPIDDNGISVANMQSLTELVIPQNSGVTNLKGLQEATNLKVLNAEGNQITDITPLIGLKKLETLNLSRNKITEVTNITNDSNPALKTFNLQGNTELTKIENINLSVLTDLNIRYCDNLQTVRNVKLDNVIEFNIKESSKLVNFEKVSLNNISSLEITAAKLKNFSVVSLENATKLIISNYESGYETGLNKFTYVNAPKVTEFASEIVFNVGDDTSKGGSVEGKGYFEYINLEEYSGGITFRFTNGINSNIGGNDKLRVSNLNIPRVTSMVVPTYNLDAANQIITSFKNVNANSMINLSLGKILSTTNRNFIMKNVSLDALTSFGGNENYTKTITKMENVSMASLAITILSAKHSANSNEIHYRNVYAPNLLNVDRNTDSGYNTMNESVNVENVNFDSMEFIGFIRIKNMSNRRNGNTSEFWQNTGTRGETKINFEDIIGTNVIKLTISNKNIENIESIVNFGDLREISITNTDLDNISLFKNLRTRSLTSVILNNSKIRDIGPIKYIAENNPNLTSVSVTNQNIDISVYKNLSGNNIKMVLTNPLADSEGIIASNNITYTSNNNGITVNGNIIDINVANQNGAVTLNEAIRFNAPITIQVNNNDGTTRSVRVNYSGTINLKFLEENSSGQGNGEIANNLTFNILNSNGTIVNDRTIKTEEIESVEAYYADKSNFRLSGSGSSNHEIKNITINGIDASTGGNLLKRPSNGLNSINEVKFNIGKVGQNSILYTKTIKIYIDNNLPTLEIKEENIDYFYGEEIPNLQDYIIDARDNEDGEDLKNQVNITVTGENGTEIPYATFFSQVTNQTVGTYTIKFSLTDRDSNTTYKTIKVRINPEYVKGLSQVITVAFNRALGKNDNEELTREEILTLRTLDLSNITGFDKTDSNVLEGLQYARNLETLNVSGYNISLLKNMAFSKLTTLNAQNSTGLSSDFTFSKSSLPRLSTLNLNGSDITNSVISKISTLTSLSTINLENCTGITSITGLNMPNLSSLSISGNLQYFNNNTLTNLSELSINMTNLVSFNGNTLLNENLRMNISGEKNLLTFNNNTLKFSGNFSFSDFNKLRTITGNTFENLNTLSIQNNSQLTDFSNNTFGVLTELYIKNNDKLTSINNTINTLTSLHLEGNSLLTNLNLESFTNLTNLKIINSNLTEFNNKTMQNLKTLELTNNSRLTSFTGNNLVKLNSITISNNAISNISNNTIGTQNDEPMSFTLSDNSTLTTFNTNNIGKNNVEINLSLSNYRGTFNLNNNFFNSFKGKIVGLDLYNVDLSKITLSSININDLKRLKLPNGIKSFDEFKTNTGSNAGINFTELIELQLSEGFETLSNRSLPKLQVLTVPSTVTLIENLQMPELQTLTVLNNSAGEGITIKDTNLGKVTTLSNTKIKRFSNNFINSATTTFSFEGCTIGTLSDLDWRYITQLDLTRSVIDSFANVNIPSSSLRGVISSIRSMRNVTMKHPGTLNLSNLGLEVFENIVSSETTNIDLSNNKLSTISGSMPKLGANGNSNFTINLEGNNITNFVNLNENLKSFYTLNTQDIRIWDQSALIEVPVDENGTAIFDGLIFSDTKNSGKLTVRAVSNVSELTQTENEATIYTDGGTLTSEFYSYLDYSGDYKRTITWNNVSVNPNSEYDKEILLSGCIGGLEKNNTSHKWISSWEGGKTRIKIKFVEMNSQKPEVEIDDDITVSKSEYEKIVQDVNSKNSSKTNEEKRNLVIKELQKKAKDGVIAKSKVDGKLIIGYEYKEMPESLTSKDKNKIYVTGWDDVELPVLDENGKISEPSINSNILKYTVVDSYGNITEQERVLKIVNYVPQVSWDTGVTIDEYNIVKNNSGTNKAYGQLTDGLTLFDIEDGTIDSPTKVEIVTRIEDETTTESVVEVQKPSDSNNQTRNSTQISTLTELISKLKQPGTHTIRYTVTDKDNNTVTAERSITLSAFDSDNVFVVPEAFVLDQSQEDTEQNKKKYTVYINASSEAAFRNTSDFNGVSLQGSAANDYQIKKTVNTSTNSTIRETSTNTFKVTYSLEKRTSQLETENSNSNLPSIELTVNVTNSAPTITFTGDWTSDIENPLKIKVGETVDLLQGVTATDQEDGNITSNILYTQIDTRRLVEDDIVEVVYTVRDSDNNYAEAKRYIKCIGERTTYELDNEISSKFIDKGDTTTTIDLYEGLNITKTVHKANGTESSIISGDSLSSYIKVYYKSQGAEDTETKTEITSVEQLKSLPVGNYTLVYEFNKSNAELSREVSELLTESIEIPLSVSEFNIPDLNLAEAIKEQLGLAEDYNLKRTDLTRLTTFDATNKNITDLTGLEYATNLTTLILKNNNLSDNSNINLNNFTKLTTLDLSGNQISSIASLKGLERLTNLTTISLENNSLNSLEIDNNAEFDFSVFNKLQTLNLSSNKIFKIDTLSTTATEVNLSRNNITSINRLNLQSVTNLDLSYNRITALSLNEVGTTLTNLNLSNNNISNISSIVYLNNIAGLRTVDLSSNSLKNINLLTLTNIEELNLSNNSIAKISNSNFGNLKNLNVSGNNLTGFENVRIQNLEVLNASNNSISNLDGITLTNLKTINMADNQFTDLTFLENLTNLEEINFSNNQISNINLDDGNSVFNKLSKLNTVDISNNSLREFLFLNNSNIRNISLSGNNITYLESVYLPKVTTFDIGSNVTAIIDVNLPLVTSLNTSNTQVIYNSYLPLVSLRTRMSNIQEIIGTTINELDTGVSNGISSIKTIKDVTITGLGNVYLQNCSNLTTFENVNILNSNGAFNIASTGVTELKNISAPNITSVDLSNLNLSTIENANFSSLVNNSNFTNNTVQTINNTTLIKDFDLSGITNLGNIKFTKATSIEGLNLKSLESFDISSENSNKLTKFKDINLENSTNVNLTGRLSKTLDIGNVRLNTLASEEENRHLILNISNNEFTDLSALNGFVVENLTQLNLSSNDLVSIDENLETFITTNISNDDTLTINLDNNRIQDISQVNKNDSPLNNSNVKLRITNQNIKGTNIGTSNNTITVTLQDFVKGIDGYNITFSEKNQNEVETIDNTNTVTFNVTSDKEEKQAIFTVKSNETSEEERVIYSGTITVIARTGASPWLSFKNETSQNLTVSVGQFEDFVEDTLNSNVSDVININGNNPENKQVITVIYNEYTVGDTTVLERKLYNGNVEIIKTTSDRTVKEVYDATNMTKTVITTTGEETVTSESEEITELPLVNSTPEPGNFKEYKVSYELEGEEEKLEITITVTNYVPSMSLNSISLIDKSFDQDALDNLLRTGIEATDREDGVISNIVGSEGENGIYIPSIQIDDLLIGNNVIVYSITDSDGNTVKVSRTLTILDNQAPVISGVNDRTLKLSEIEFFEHMEGVSALDDHDGEVTVSLKEGYEEVLEQIRNYTGKDEDGNSIETKTFELVYVTQDSTGLTSEVKRNIIITNYAPVVTLETDSLVIRNSKSEEFRSISNILSGVSAVDNEDGPITINTDTVKIYLISEDGEEIEYDEETVLESGEYTLRYEVSDSDKNVTTIERNLIVRSESATPKVSVDDIIKTNRDVDLLKSGDSVIHSEGIVIDYAENLKSVNRDIEQASGLNIKPMNANEIEKVPAGKQVTYTIYYNTDEELTDNYGEKVTQYINKDSTGNPISFETINYQLQSEEDDNVDNSTDSEVRNTGYGFTRNITISNYNPEINSKDSIEITAGIEVTLSEFKEKLQLSATDREDGDLTNKINISDFGGLNLAYPSEGTYNVKFIVIDNDSNVTEKIVKVVVNYNPNLGVVQPGGSIILPGTGGSSSSGSSSGGSASIGSASSSEGSSNNSSSDSEEQTEIKQEIQTEQNTMEEVKDINKLEIDTIKLPTQIIKEVEFKDVPTEHWASTSINKLANLGIINGINQEQFDMDSDIKRADVVVMLVKLLGLDTNVKSTFIDVSNDKYYANYLGAAQAYNIINGYEDNTFRPEKNITRQDAMVITAKAIQDLGIEPVNNIDIAVFKDIDQVSSYAKQSIEVLVRLGVVNGSGGKLNPKETITRAEMSVMISKIYDLIKSQIESNK